jgi:hypothetical protein
MGFVQIQHTINERNPKIILETCECCKRREQKYKEQKHSWLKDRWAKLSAVPDQGLRAYPL